MSLKLKNVSFTLPHVAKPIVNNITYLICPGDFIILLGSNGSGKSSLLKLLTKQYIPSTGDILLNDESISTQKINKRIAILTQHADDSLFPSLTLYENYLLKKQQSLLSITHHHDEREFLQKYLLEYNPKLTLKLDTEVSKLSGGEKQAFVLALCFLQPPALLLLDEHTSALDPKASADIMRITQAKIMSENITCIMTTHDLDFALQYGNRILMLHDGNVHKMIESSEKKSLTRSELIKYYY